MVIILSPFQTNYRLSDCNWTRTHNHLVLKRTLNRLAKLAFFKWLSWVVSTYLYGAELSGCGFESSCSHLNFRSRACFEPGVPWQSSNYRVWIHSKMRTWHDKNIKSNYKLITSKITKIKEHVRNMTILAWIIFYDTFSSHMHVSVCL